MTDASSGKLIDKSKASLMRRPAVLRMDLHRDATTVILHETEPSPWMTTDISLQYGCIRQIPEQEVNRNTPLLIDPCHV